MGGQSSDFGSSSDYDFDSKPSVTKRSAASYAKTDKREYVAPSKGLPSIVGKDITSDSKLVASILLDDTGSMHEIPGMFIEKMPTLYAEANAAVQGKSLKELEKGEKLNDLLDIAVVTIGDVKFDQYPLQVLNYCKGADLVKGVLGIYPEGGGGGNLEESYDLGGYYLLNHSKTPKANKPLLIIVGDEGFEDSVSARHVKALIGDDLSQDVDTKDVFTKLSKKFDTYVLRPEIHYSASDYARIQKQWEGVFGPQRVLKMNGYDRVVDCIIGICGYAADNFEEAENLLKRRQTPAQVDDVLETLHPLLSSKKYSRKPSKSAGKS